MTLTHPWNDLTLSPDERAGLVVAAMSEDEKFAWLSGPMAIPFGAFEKPEGALGSAGFFPAIERLGIPARQETDASLGIGNINGVRPGENATALPSSLLLGATFDPAIAFETGALIGREAHAKGFNTILAGGANLVRESRGGRNFEYVSEDPPLTAAVAGRSIAGIQSENVVSTIKHFVLNAEETGRVMLSADIGEAALRESDLLAMQMAIEIGQPGSVMPGYNLLNGQYVSESAFLLNEVLKGDWNYKGWVMSDWGATHSTEKAILAGLDVQSGANLDPEPFFGEPLRKAVAEGRVPQERIDDAVRRQLRSLFAVGAIERPANAGGAIDYAAHRLIAQRAVESGLVLLKNDEEFLPLNRKLKRVLVVGPHVDAGVLAGGGSSSVTPIDSLKLEGIQFAGLNAEKIYHPSSPLRAIRAEGEAEETLFFDGRDRTAAAEAAREADAVIVFADAWRTEGMDTIGLRLPDGQDALIEALADANDRVVVVIEAGGPILMPWLDRVRSVVMAFFSGSGGGEAIAGVLFGRVNPSGRLPFTFPLDENQLPRPDQIDPETVTSSPGQPLKGDIVHVSYDIEGSDVGYRWFEREKHQPLYPFGHGLSYTSFSYDAFEVGQDGDRVTLRVDVANTGTREGAEVVQFYASLDGDSGFVSRLVGFTKLALQPGQTGSASVVVDNRLLSRFRQQGCEWQREAGTYRFSLRRNATDILQESGMKLESVSQQS